MKNTIFAALLSCLLSTGLFAPTSAGEKSAQSNSISGILRAHSFPQDRSFLTTVVSEALVLQVYEGSSDGKLHNFFVRRESLVVRGESFRHDILALDGQARESYVSDGRGNRWIRGPRGRVEDGVAESQFRIVENRIRQFGLPPILLQLADPRTETTYLGRTASGDDKFEVTTSSGTWTLFSDESQLIRRLDVGNRTILFSDFRLVDGAMLPFNERVLIGGKPFYELSFNKIVLNRKLDPEVFR
jgi:hypothetical protein